MSISEGGKPVVGRGEGRPTILTPELLASIETYVKGGNYIETACALAGVGRSTYFSWMKRGKDEPESIYGEFLDSMEKAAAWSEARDVQLITEASRKNWTAAAWRLERKFPGRWGRQDNMKLTHQGGIGIAEVDGMAVTPEEREIFKENWSVFFPDVKLEDPDAGSEG